jgi:hypothetical protein
MRKVLYSPDYGAGWVSWHDGTRQEKKFMLEYEPIVLYLESGKKFSDCDRDFQPLELYEQFKKDWDTNFPDKKGIYPYFGGLRDLEVTEIPDNVLVEITDYDGYESIKLHYESEFWL